MTEKRQFEKLLVKVQKILTDEIPDYEKLAAICQLLYDQIDYYDWVGFYLIDPKNENELVLGSFVGEPTEHMRIPFGRGICGQAAERKETLVVQDVSQQTNYLSCSTTVKSEIVVPLIKNQKILGELDIDSHQLSPFTKEDQWFLEETCMLITESLYLRE